MTYKEVNGNLFDAPKEYYLAHCISADFGMGKGIVVEFNNRYDMKNKLQARFPNYLSWYNRVNIGGDCLLEGKVFNLITKEHYWDKPTLQTMKKALMKMRHLCLKENVFYLAMPKIGAGLDRLNWNDVSKLLQEVFKDTDIDVVVYYL